VGFDLNRQHPIFPRSLFGGEIYIPINRLVDEMLWPTSCNGKFVHCIEPFKMSNPHYNLWEVGWLLETTINPPLDVLNMDKSIIFCMVKSKQKKYEVTTGNFLACTCLDFVKMISSLLGRWRKWVPYKHMYYVL